VNDAGFNASSEHLRSSSATASPSLGFHRAAAWPARPAVSRNRRRARTSTTTLTDFCNRRKARAHWRTIVTRRSAAFHDEALRLAALRRCETAPTVRDWSQRRARHGSRLWYPTWTSQSPAPAPIPWRVTECSEASLGPPRERRANGQTLGNEPGCLSSYGIRPFLFDPDWPRSASFTPALPAPLVTWEGSANR
jgi:hypothetical protein